MPDIFEAGSRPGIRVSTEVATKITNIGAQFFRSLSRFHRIRPLVIVVLWLIARGSDACYVYPPDVRDPCEGKVCSFGAQCARSLDGLTARCQCQERCELFGDNIGSAPVCGNDSVDYANMCELRRASCRDMKDIHVKYYGKCGMYLIYLFYLFYFNYNNLLILLTLC